MPNLIIVDFYQNVQREPQLLISIILSYRDKEH